MTKRRAVKNTYLLLYLPKKYQIDLGTSNQENLDDGCDWSLSVLVFIYKVYQTTINGWNLFCIILQSYFRETMLLGGFAAMNKYL